MFERTTRLCAMSPTIATFSPSIRPLRRRIVRASSSAWVGCSCAPSPALMTPQRELARQHARHAGVGVADDDEVRGHRRDVVRRVEQGLALATATSRSVREVDDVGRQPLLGDLERDRVRVEGSKKRLTTVLPRSVGTFLIGRSATSANDSAVDRMQLDLVDRELGDAEQVLAGQSIDSASRASAGSSFQPIAASHAPGLRSRICTFDVRSVASKLTSITSVAEVGTFRPTTSAWIGNSRQPRSISTARRTASRPAVVDQRVERRADRAAGVEHVVAQHQGATLDRLGKRLSRTTGLGATSDRSSR